MGRTGAWLFFVSIGLALAIPTLIAAQQARPSSAAASIGQSPTEHDIYCAGFYTGRATDSGMSVLGSEDAGYKNEFGTGDFIYLSKGKEAVTPGSQYLLIRPVKDPNPREVFPGQRNQLLGLGTLYADIGRVQVRAVHEGSATAEVLYACEPVQSGDLAIPLTERTAPPYHTPKVTDRFAPASGKPTGVIVMAKDFQRSLGEGEIVYLNLGSKQGAQKGSYLRVFRSYLSHDRDLLLQMTREYATEASGERMGRKLTRAERASLPRDVVGEVLVLSAEEGVSTGIITFSREEISLGDEVELE